MTSEYSNHRDQFDLAKPSNKRLENLSKAIEEAFDQHIEFRKTGYVIFEDVTVEELASAFFRYPILVKSVLTLANVASRAIKRDLNTTIDLYAERISLEKAGIIAGYVKPVLPKAVAIPSIIELDRYSWTDKEMRALKGRWEKRILKDLSSNADYKFKKRKFKLDNEEFELDAASPPEGSEIQVGVDIKRIEAQRDIHKRCEEIVNKASKFKTRYPRSYFFAVIYYPFPAEHQNVHSRVSSEHIDGVFFASESPRSIRDAVLLLLGKYRQMRKE